MNIDNTEPRYVISVAARVLGIHTHTLRYYEKTDIIEPSRSQGNTRLYSERDLAQLRRVKTLMDDLGVLLNAAFEDGVTVTITGTLPILADTITKSIKSSIESYIIAFGVISLFILILTVMGVFCSSVLSYYYSNHIPYLFLFGSVLAVSLTVLLIFICNFLVKIWSKNEEE